MADVWQTFPAQMDEHRAFISFNKSYAEVAAKDLRNAVLQVRVEVRHPTPTGMPTDAEFPALAEVEDRLDKAVTAKGGIEVGRVTVDGKRYFTFYSSISRGDVAKLISDASKGSPYRLEYFYQEEPGKDTYWKELYPSTDDWQVIRDLEVLDALRNRGDDQSKTREVSHWAYFPDEATAQKFALWAQSVSYKIAKVERTEDKKEVVVRFTHIGTMELTDITHHTIAINREAEELGGKYDGWETSVAPPK